MRFRKKKHHKKISLLVPFRADDEGRQRNWDWLRKYWAEELPEAEIVIGKDRRHPFSKTVAVNHAAKRAHGDFFVIMDADTFINPIAIRASILKIEAAARRGQKVWFIPYRRLWRLTPTATQFVLSNRVLIAPYLWLLGCAENFENPTGSLFGRRFGAMCQVMSREAFFAAGGMDPRFRGWGGEDVSFVRAVDTLWGKHKTVDYDIFHLHHEKIGTDWRDRVWQGQTKTRVNEGLASRYDKANRQQHVMEDLVREHSHIRSRFFFWKRWRS